MSDVRRKTKLRGLVLNVSAGEIISIGNSIKISAELLPGSRSNEISVVINAPRDIIISRDNYCPDRGVIDAVKPGKRLYRGNLK